MLSMSGKEPSAAPVDPPVMGDTWVGVLSGELPVEDVRRWVTVPQCGAVVVFTGVVRDHSEGRAGVTGLTYEAYEEEAGARLAAVASEMRTRWADAGRIALVHRVGDVDLGEPTVVVAVSSPHRAEAFEAARFGIDTLKETVPIWKREHWSGGSDWAVCDHELSGRGRP